jgi:hypothetical protein
MLRRALGPEDDEPHGHDFPVKAMALRTISPPPMSQSRPIVRTRKMSSVTVYGMSGFAGTVRDASSIRTKNRFGVLPMSRLQ